MGRAKKKINSFSNADFKFIRRMSKDAPIDPPPELISGYVHQKRIIPPGEPREGILNVYYMPHLVEPMDTMSPYSPVQICSILKSVQAGVTFNCAENVIAYYMGAKPAQILYATATEVLLGKWTKRLEPLIESCGLRGIMSSHGETYNAKSRKSPDKMYSKEYPGGSLSMTSLQSPAGLRSETKQILVIDEIDGAPARLTTGEGSALSTLYGRVAAFGSRSKIMEFSTPTTLEKSIIFKRYQAGDQRKYYVPCPIDGCGVYQELVFDQLKPVYDVDGVLDSAWYECKECGGRIENYQKTEMLKLGEWRATAKPTSKNHRSYHVTALYNPVGMFSWEQIYKKYLEAEEDPINLMPSFRMLYLGEPYKEQGHRPPKEKIEALRGDYRDGTVPEGVIYLTMASDVQRGAEKYQKMSPEELAKEIETIRSERGELALWKSKIPRIESEIMGTGKFRKTWSVDYKVFYGHTTLGSYAGAFEEIQRWSEEGNMTYKRQDGVPFNVMVALMDASDGLNQDAVFDLCSRWRGTYPNINKDFLLNKKDDGLDERSGLNIDRYRFNSRGAKVCEYLNVSTNYYKAKFYSAINTQRKQGEGNTPYGYCEFPINRPDHYFAMLRAEEQRADGSFHNGGRPAEALDCRSYNLAAADFWLEAQVKSKREWAKKAGYSPDDVKKFDMTYVLTEIEKGIFAIADKMGLVK